MSTDMLPTSRFHLTRFYGGKERGVCLQATTKSGTVGPDSRVWDNGYITVSKAEAMELAIALIGFAAETLPEDPNL